MLTAKCIYRIVAMTLTFALVLNISPFITSAKDAQTGANGGYENTIEVPLGTPESAVIKLLPNKLNIVIPQAADSKEAGLATPSSATPSDTGTEIEIDIKWAAPRGYDANTPGKYIFEAGMTSQEALAYEIELPEVTVTVLGHVSSGADLKRLLRNDPEDPPEPEDYAEAFEMTADGDTGGSYDMIFINGAADDGRVWTDKSVSTGAGADADEFHVTLSALAQAVHLEQDDNIPSDTVFILDVSASMMQPADKNLPEGPSRIVVMIDALNEAIGLLLRDNPANRIAVVAFGGHVSRGQTPRAIPVLALNRYNEITDGVYFSMASPGYVQIDGDISESKILFQNYNPSRYNQIRVWGGTSTQWGIYEAAKLLTDENLSDDRKYGEDNVDPPRPNIVLLTDGEPTFGWQDFTFSDPDSLNIEGDADSAHLNDATISFSNGNGNDVQMGQEILAVLTASYLKQQVSRHYYIGDGDPRKAGFYTIGLGVEDSDDARATLDPAGIKNDEEEGRINADKISNSLGSTTYNMREALDNMIRSGSASFPAIVKRKTGREVVNVAYPADFPPQDRITSYNYPDYYGEASNAAELDEFFHDITTHITSQGYYVTSVIDDPAGMYESTHTSYADYSGAVVFSDVIGEYMDFKGFDHLLYRDKQYNGAIFAHRIAQENGDSFEEDIMTAGPTTTKLLNTMLASQLFFRGISNGRTEAQALEVMYGLLNSCLAAGNGGNEPDEYGIYYTEGDTVNFGNRIRFYAGADGTWVANYFDSDGTPVLPAPAGAECIVDQYYVNGAAQNTVSGNPSDLTYSIFEVITALEDIDVEETNFTVADTVQIQQHTVATRELKEGQQMTRWIIPASLLPLRSVRDGQAPVEPDPIRFVYSVGLRSDFLPNDDPSTPADRRLDDYVDDYGYNFYSNAWQDTDNDALAHFIPGAKNLYYTGSLNEAPVGKVDAAAIPETGIDAIGSPVDMAAAPVWYYPLGNNGRLTVPLTGLEVKKNWDSRIVTAAGLKDVYIQLYHNGAAVGTPKLIEKNGSYTTEIDGSRTYTATWEPCLLRYEPEADGNGKARQGQYQVREGWMDNGVFEPFEEVNDPDTGFTIMYSQQPTWDSNEMTMTATVNNLFQSDYTWVLEINKKFLNLPEGFEDELRRQNASIEFIPLVRTFNSSGTPTDIFKVLRKTAEEGITVRYPDHFLNGTCRILMHDPADYSTNTDMEPYTINVLLVEKKALIDGYEWGEPSVLTNGDTLTAPSEMNDRIQELMIGGEDDLFERVADAGVIVEETDTIYTFAQAGVVRGSTVTFDIENRLEKVEPQVASLSLKKDIVGDINMENFAARFIIEGWKSEGDVLSRSLENRVYYQTIDYINLAGDDLINLLVPEEGGDAYYYTVTERAAGSIHKDAASIFEKGDLQGVGSGGIEVEELGPDMVGFELDEDVADGATVTLRLTNVYTRLAPPSGEITLEKRLTGDYSGRGVTGGTQFMARVKSPDMEAYLAFDENNVFTGYTLDTDYSIAFSADQPARLTDIPLGSYVVEEQISSGYRAGYRVGATATNEVTLTGEDSSVTVGVTNTYPGGGGDDDDDDDPPRDPDPPRYDLTVKKTVTGDTGNPDAQKLFRFQVVYAGAASIPYGRGAIPLSIGSAPGAVRVSGTGIDQSRIQGDSQGKPTILLLKHGEAATLKSLYVGSYRIVELDRGGYETAYTIGAGQKTVVTAAGETQGFILRRDTTVSFTNTAADTPHFNPATGRQ